MYYYYYYYDNDSFQTGERLQELRGHSQQITAMTTFTCRGALTTHTALITASSDRSLSVSCLNTRQRVMLRTDCP